MSSKNDISKFQAIHYMLTVQEKNQQNNLRIHGKLKLALQINLKTNSRPIHIGATKRATPTSNTSYLLTFKQYSYWSNQESHPHIVSINFQTVFILEQPREPPHPYQQHIIS